MGDWQELGQAVFVGLIFSFLVAKLISVAISFKESNLKLTRSEPDPEPVSEPQPESETEISEEETPINTTSTSKNIDRSGIIGNDSGSDDDSDSWEGIESTELDEEFSAASAFVATMAATSESARVSSEMQLKLYGLYKIATEGPCTAPQPSALNFSARAKW
jgi:acyl-CoA-binding protein